jgi:MoxR-like ATPase/chorismate-pyruvate lyase
MFVLDEINLAEDAVIERLNSVLESGREITLAEKGDNQSDKIIAHPHFRIIATMNPGGDFGKRELSPALRSRFTELWIPAASSGQDTLLVVRELLHLTNGVDADSVAAVMVNFTDWLQAATLDVTTGKIRISVREVLAWARFVSQMAPADALATYTALLDGVHMILLDGLGIGVSVSRDVVDALKARSVAHLLELCPDHLREQLTATFVEGSSSPINVDKGNSGELFGNARFSVSIGPSEASRGRGTYAIQAENTRLNVHRVLRALQVRRPILLEGPPGVGKSSLVANLATMSGHTLVRINLSEHSELSDLLGTDLPVDDAGDGGAAAGPKFKWCDGVFLKAIRAGHWVLLDEMNLAPQSVLEGLNACFDHREEIFLPEIGLTVKCPPSFRVFCAQNPMVEGGGRKGLPQSLLTRFSRVFVEPMTESNLLEVAKESFSGRLPPRIADNLARYVTFVHRLQADVTQSGSFGRQGSPWEFNLRDVFRWCELLKRTHVTLGLQDENGADAHVVLQESAYMLFVSRLRSSEDRTHVERVFQEVFGMPCIADANPPVAFRATFDSEGQLSVDIGLSRLPVRLSPRRALSRSEACVPVGSYHARTLSDLATCVDMRWPALVVGQSGSGKRSCVRQLAKMTGQHLLELAATSSTDSAELLGSFEQANQYRDVDECLEDMWSAALAMSVVGSRSADVQSANGEEGKLTEVRVVLARLTAQQSAASAVMAREALYLEDGVALVRGMRESMDALQYLVRHDDWLGAHACGRATVQSSRSQLARAHNSLGQIEAHMQSVAAGGQGASSFVWRDGVVVQALERGHWLMIDNVNMCSASLLDRLNSVLEPGGSILLTESGDGRVITPHPAFRVFLVMDPSAGDISRAMRNRCVEVFVPTQEGRSCGDATLATLSAASPDLRSYFQLAGTLRALNAFKTTVAPPSFPVAKVFAAICDVFSTARHLGQSEEEAMATARQLCGCALQSAEEDGSEEVAAYSDSDADASLTSQLPSLSALLHARTYFPSADLGPTFAGRLAQEQWLQCASDACLMRAPATVQEQCTELVQLRAAADPTSLSVFLAARGAAARFAAPDVYGGLLAGAAGASDGAGGGAQGGASAEACGQASIALARHLGLTDVSAWAVGEAVNESLLGRLQSSRWNAANTLNGEQLQALWVLLQLLVMDRWADVWLEGCEDTAGASASCGKASFFRVAGLVTVDRLPADSPQRLVLRDVFALFSMVDRFTADIVGQGVAVVTSVVSGFDDVLSPLQDMVRARDMLSRTLRAGTAQDGTPMPWDQILVSSRWMKKALLKLQRSPVLAAQTSVVLQDMTNLERRLATHWGGHPLQSKSLLWRDSGRSFLPAQRSDWVLLERLRAIVPHILLSGEAGDAGRAPSQRSESFTLIKEWLSLYATFFWATTQELGPHVRGRKTARVDLEHLVEALERRCTMHEASRQLDERRRYWTSVAAAPEDEAVPAGDNGEVLPHNDEDEVDFALSKATVALIRREAAEAGEDSVAALAEAMVLQLLFQLGDATAQLMLRPHAASYRSLTVLRGLCRHAMDTALRYSGLSPLWLREVRSLLWCIEAELPDTPPGDVDMAISIDATALSAYCVTCTTVLSYRLDAMLRAASGRLSTLQSRWTSATLDALLKDVKGGPDPGAGSADRAQMAASASALTGAVALVQPNTLRVVLRNVDARLLSPRDKVLCTQKLISFGSAELTVSACSHAGPRLLQLFRNTVVAGSQGGDACALVTRPMLLQVLVLDVIQSCRAAVTDPTVLTAAVATARAALRQGAPPHTVFSVLKNANFTAQCSDEFPGVLNLLQKCLDPVLALLADARSAPDLATSGELWLRVGLMRLHLLLPPTPVDPSAKNIAKADLLEGAATQLGASLLARHYSHAAGSGQALTLDEQALLTRQCATRARARTLREKSIQRPSDAPPFEGLFLELQEFSRTLGSVDRVLELRSVCGSACGDILSVLGADSGASTSSANAEGLMATLDRVERQEAGWQHSSAAFRTRLEREYFAYEDVVSSVMSAIENISTGLGLCVAAPCMRARDSYISQSVQGPHEMARAWLSIASYPHCAVLTMGGSSGKAPPASVAVQAVATINELLRFSGHLATKTHRTIQILNTDAERGGLIGSGNDGSLPSASAVENVAPSVLLLLALARMEFYVASGITTPKQVAAVFAQLMDKFVEHQLRAEEARRQKAAEEAALFKYKPKADNFVSDEAAEEEALLKQNFPDHLSEFKGILDAMQGGLGDGADNNGDVAVADGEAVAAPTTEMSFDDTCSMSMVSAHARMSMLHGSRELADQGVVWRRCASPGGLFAASAQLHTTATSEVLSRASMVAGRALSLSLGGLVESGLDASTRGASLEALGTMARRCLSVQPADAVKASSSWLAGVAATVPVDRDLLYLLDHRAHGAWNPLDFHTDPHMEEVRLAHGPLQALQDRVADLLLNFPGNDVLVLVFKLCARVNGFHLATPLGKMLMALELLLRKAQEWEQFASREFSLHEHTQALARLISRWREVELASWPEMLRCKEILAAQGAVPRWTALARVLTSRATVRSASVEFVSLLTKAGRFDADWPECFHFAAPAWLLVSDDPDAATAATNATANANSNTEPSVGGPEAWVYLTKIFDIVDGFLRGTVVGEFPLRLHMVRMWAIQLLRDSRASSVGRMGRKARLRAQTKEQTANLVFGLWQYYAAFLPHIREFQERLRLPIYDKIRDEVKISKWDVLNTYALLEHSDKVHRKLSRLIGEYQKDALEYPVNAVLRRVLVGGLYSEHGELEAASDVPSDVHIFPPLEHAGATVPKKARKSPKAITGRPGKPAREVGASVAVRDDDCTAEIPITLFPLDAARAQRAKATAKSCEATICTLPDAVLAPASKARRVGFFTQRVHSYLRSALAPSEQSTKSARFGSAAATSADDLCGDIFDRIQSLRGEGVPKAIKRRAVGDLLKALKSEGVSSLRADTSPRLRESVAVLCLPAPLSLETATDAAFVADGPRDLCERGEMYYMRNVSELSEFRTQLAAARSPDVTHHDAALMLTLADNLMLQVVRQRCSLRQALGETRSVATSARRLQETVAASASMETTAANECGVDASRRLAPTGGAGLEILLEDLSCKRAAAQAVMCNFAQLETLMGTAVLAANPAYVEINPAVRTLQSSAGNKLVERVRKLGAIVRDAIVATAAEGGATSVDTGADSLALLGGGTDHTLLGPSGLRLDAAALGGGGGIRSVAMAEDAWIRLERAAVSVHGALVGTALEVSLAQWVSTDVVSTVVGSVRAWAAASRTPLADAAVSGTTAMDGLDPTTNATPSSSVRLLEQCQEDVLIGVQRLRQVASRGAEALTRVATESAAEFGTAQDKGAADGSVESANIDGDDLSATPPDPRLPMVEAMRLGLAAVAAAPIQRMASRLARAAASGAPDDASADQWRALANSTLVLVDALVEARILLVEDVARCYQASGKLLYVVLRVFRTLAAKGVCSNEEEEVEGDGKGMSFEDDVEGTGMGEGDGKKDVSDQIENEDQLSGLKNEEQKDKDEDQEKEKQDKDEDKAIEMTQDFAGEMEDISDDENEDEDQDDGDEREELEREMGECNEDDVVDEKQWDEKEDEVSGEEKMEKDSKTQGQEIEGEMTTKDDDDDDNGGKDEKDKKEAEGGPEEEKDKDKDKPELDAGDDEGPEAGAAGADEDGGDDPQQEPNAGEEEMETPAGVDVREEEEKDEGDAGDDAEGEGEGEGEDEEEKGEGEGEGEEGADGPGAELGDDDKGDDGDEGDGDELPENMQLDGDDDAEGGDDDDDEAEAGEDGEDPDAMAVEEDDDEGEGPEDKPDDADEGAGVTGAGNMPENEVPEPEEPERGEDDGDMEVDPAATGEDEGLPDAFGVQSNAGKEAVLGADEAEGEGGEMKDDEDEEAPTPTGGSSGDGGQQEDAGDASGADHASGARPEERAGTSKDDVPNPLREQGDVNEKWHRRLNVEMRTDKDAGFEDPADEATDGSRKDTYEYAGREEGGTEQVLADADQEESATQLPEGGETERGEEEEEDKNKLNGEEDADEDGPAVDVDGEGKEKKSRSRDGPPAAKQKEEDVAVPPEGGEDADELDDKDGDGDNDLVDDADENVPMDFPEAEDRDAAPTRDGFTSNAASDGAMEVDDDRGEDDDEADERFDERAAAALVEAWRDDARVDDGGAARALWAKYRSATDAHSIRLCEQLRLILEPSLATRLQGDYRTGKRINMKKVIGFIASGFRKDKIWLRRTKPAKRDYQVMLMIDDSSSMGQAGPLALASMATIANALTKLEVGEMSVASFADDVSILHPFGRPFTDDVGADVFQHFKFQASTTRLGASLETCVPLFEQARDSSASSAQSTTLQLCFVISDARIDTDNREDLQALVRRMAEKHILVVLIIIDKNADDKESVFNTQSVSFTPQGIVMRSYMDNFPFQFYLTISDIDRLPDILCDALKQWFEMVRAQLDSR